MIDIVLLTGFLGAGKTTLITNLLNQYKDKKIGVIINEFGSINVDAKLISRNGIELMELSNGSIFCACLKEHFLKSLIEMSGKDIEVLFIEASGLADPSNMSQILTSIEHMVVKPYNYKGVVAVVDSDNFIKLYDLLPALHRQVEYSNLAIINKEDLVSADRLYELRRMLIGINPSIAIQVTSYCKVPCRDIIDSLNGVEIEAKDTTNTIETRPKSFVLTGQERISYEALHSFLCELAASTFRIKGFAETDKGSFEISTVGTNIKLLPWKEELINTEIVLISSVGIKIISEITRGIEKYLKGKIHFRR